MSLGTAFSHLELVFENPAHYKKWKSEKAACLPKEHLAMFNKDVAFFNRKNINTFAGRTMVMYWEFVDNTTMLQFLPSLIQAGLIAMLRILDKEMFKEQEDLANLLMEFSKRWPEIVHTYGQSHTGEE